MINYEKAFKRLKKKIEGAITEIRRENYDDNLIGLDEDEKIKKRLDAEEDILLLEYVLNTLIPVALKESEEEAT